MTDVRNKIVLITGASSGIGQACVLKFAEQGARIILCARRVEPLKQLTETLLQKYSVPSLSLVVDVTDNITIENAMTRLPAEWRDIDILVNNAGLALGYDKLYSGNVAEWDRVIDTNIKGMVYMIRAVTPGMVARQQGHIINIGSISSHQVYAGGSVYCATKYAVRGLTDTLRMDVHGTPIRVSLINPGMVKTDFFDVRFHGDQQKAEEMFAGMIPLQPEDVADTVVYCATRPPHVAINEINIMPIDQTGHLTYRRTEES